VDVATMGKIDSKHASYEKAHRDVESARARFEKVALAASSGRPSPATLEADTGIYGQAPAADDPGFELKSRAPGSGAEHGTGPRLRSDAGEERPDPRPTGRADEFLVEPVILSLVSGPPRSRPADCPRHESDHDHRDERDDHPIEHGEAATAAIAASVSPSTVLGQDHPQR
jgi:hypothetical protein